MKKLFVWAYTHDPKIIQTCALTEEGILLFMIESNDHKEAVRLLFSGNEKLSEEYKICLIDQHKLETHIYKGGSRDLLPKDFQIAWDKYKELALN